MLSGRARRTAAGGLALLLSTTSVAAAPLHGGRQAPAPPAAPVKPGAPPGKPGAQAKTPDAQASPPATPVPPPETKPYDPQLMRLAEILGALTYLRGLCGAKDADAWRQRMQALLDAEGKPDVRKDRLAGAYNRGIQGYSFSYHSCTPNARLVIERFLAEGERIAKEVENRYRAT